MEVYNIVQEAVIKTIPKKKKWKKMKWLFEEALQIAKKWRETKDKGDFVVEPEVRQVDSSSSILLSQDCFGYSRFFVFPYKSSGALHDQRNFSSNKLQKWSLKV